MTMWEYPLGMILLPFVDACHIAGLARAIPASSEVHKYEPVAERITDDGYPTDRDVAGLTDHAAAGVDDGSSRGISGVDEPVRFGIQIDAEHDLCVTLGAPQSRLSDLVVAPQQAMSQVPLIERKSSVKVRDPEGHCIDLPKDRLVHSPCPSIEK